MLNYEYILLTLALMICALQLRKLLILYFALEFLFTVQDGISYIINFISW